MGGLGVPKLWIPQVQLLVRKVSGRINGQMAYVGAAVHKRDAIKMVESGVNCKWLVGNHGVNV